MTNEEFWVDEQHKSEERERTYRRIWPEYDYRQRHGRWPPKNWDPTEVPHEKRLCLLETRKRAPGKLYGYATRWKTPCVDDRNRCVWPGAFANFLQTESDCSLIVSHDWTRGVLARRSEGGLFLAEDRLGLYFEAKLPDSDLGNHVRAMADARPSFGMSFDYAIRESEFRDGVSELLRVDLKEISLLPDQEGAIAGARAWLQR